MRWILLSPCSFWNRFCQVIFYQKTSKLFWTWRLISIGLIWQPAKLIESYKNAKDEHFSSFHSSCQWGFKANMNCFEAKKNRSHMLSLLIQAQLMCYWKSPFFLLSACPKGTYKPSLEPGDKRSCFKCPHKDQISPLGSWDVSQCRCKDGYRFIKGKWVEYHL